MNKRKINEQELNYIVENSIRKTLNEKEQINEYAPLAALGGAALRMGGKALAKKGFNKLARKGIKTFGKKGMKNLTKAGGSIMKNIGADAIGNMFTNKSNNKEEINLQQLIQAFQYFMEIYQAFKNSGSKTDPKFDNMVNMLSNMLTSSK